VSLDPAAGSTVTVDYATHDGAQPNGATAAERDYSPVHGTLTFTPGQTAQTVMVPINATGSQEANEGFSLDLTNAQGASIAAGSGTVQIDTKGVGLTVDDSRADAPLAGTASEQFKVSLNQPAVGPVTVAYQTQDGTGPDAARAGSDYVATQGTLTFPAGVTSQVVTVVINAKPVVKGEAGPNRSFSLELSAITGANLNRASATGTIEVRPKVLTSTAKLDEPVHGSSPERFPISLNHPYDQPVTVRYATADGTGKMNSVDDATAAKRDYAPTAGTVTFAPGETTHTVDVPVNATGEAENPEFFRLVLSAPTNAYFGEVPYGATAIGLPRTVPDDTDVGQIVPPAALNAHDQAVGLAPNRSQVMNLAVVLSHAASHTVRVAYATSDGTGRHAAHTAIGDYHSKHGTLTFAPGTIKAFVKVPVHTRPRLGIDRYFTLTLSHSSGAGIATPQARGEIGNEGKVGQLGYVKSLTPGLTGHVYVQRAGSPAPMEEIFEGDPVFQGDVIAPQDNTASLVQFYLGGAASLPPQIQFTIASERKIGQGTPQHPFEALIVRKYQIWTDASHQKSTVQFQTTAGVMGIKG